MYIKTINDRQVFSDCRNIQDANGRWISNPTVEQILEAGWEEYIPPETHVAKTEPEYIQLMQAIKKMLLNSASELSDEDALEVAALYPTWASKIGGPVEIGERLWYDGKLWKTIQHINVLLDNWTPDTAVSLFTQVSIEEWPEFVQPTGAHDAYNRGDQVVYNGQHYISLIDNNTWSPLDYPSGWELQS